MVGATANDRRRQIGQPSACERPHSPEVPRALPAKRAPQPRFREPHRPEGCVPEAFRNGNLGSKHRPGRGRLSAT